RLFRVHCARSTPLLLSLSARCRGIRRATLNATVLLLLDDPALDGGRIAARLDCRWLRAIQISPVFPAGHDGAPCTDLRRIGRTFGKPRRLLGADLGRGRQQNHEHEIRH
ncbi:MAG: hypothetical protein AAB650_02125, partial [Patescibacteria group bacterium]